MNERRRRRRFKDSDVVVHSEEQPSSHNHQGTELQSRRQSVSVWFVAVEYGKVRRYVSVVDRRRRRRSGRGAEAGKRDQWPTFCRNEK